MKRVALNIAVFISSLVLGVALSSLLLPSHDRPQNTGSDSSTDESVLPGSIPQVKSAAFAGKDKAWFVTRERFGELWRTKDGGKSWQETLVGDGDMYFDRMFFVDSKHGWLLGSNNIYRTENGGRSWEVVLKVTPMKISID